MININHGHNREMLSKCRPLGEYAWFVAQVRNNQADYSTGEDDAQTGIGSAIDKAIDEMPEDFEIKKFITANRAEVKDMCLTEYNEEEAMEMLKEAKRPLFLVGGGVRLAEAGRVMTDLMEVSGVPAVTTLMGRGTIPTDHPLYFGNAGMHG